MFSWQFPYASRRSPVLARNVVATSQPLAVQAGVHALQAGGNAVDAALAMAITLTVVEPSGNGIGSDAFAIVWDGETLHGLNGSGRAPRAWSPERFADRKQMPASGWDAVTVPGAVDAWVQLHRRFGGMDFARLFEPAIRYAREGYVVSPMIAARWALAARELGERADFADAFLPSGRAPQAGELFRLPAQAATLESIAASGGETFYRGSLAEQIVAHAEREGGAMTLADLAEHESTWVPCLSGTYRDIEVHELPPNGQGLAALIALGILRHHELARYPVDSAGSVHLQLEAMKVGLAEAARHISDPETMQLEPQALLDDAYLAQRAQRIDMDRAAAPAASPPAEAGTVYLAAADAAGMMVSMIQSNYEGFGSGVVVPGTGISLQNRGFGFSLEPGHPNRVGGGKRPFHTIIPGFVSRGGKPFMSFGVMGGHMQAQGHVQMLVRVLDYAQNPQAASDAPRWYLDKESRVGLERGFPPAVAAELVRRGHRLMPPEELNIRLFGGAQLICRLEDGYCAASDHRKDGHAAGF